MVDTGEHSYIVSPLGPQASPAMNDGVVRMSNISLLEAELEAEFVRDGRGCRADAQGTSALSLLL